MLRAVASRCCASARRSRAHGRADIDFGDDKPVLMTEKDAVKCASMADRRQWYVPVDANFDGGDGAALLDIVTHAIRVQRGAGEVPMDKRLLELLVCPICKGPLHSAGGGNALEFVCRADRLAYAVRDGIPLMLPEEARVLPADDPLLRR